MYYNERMEHIATNLAKIEQNIKVNSADPIALHGFTQLPNFILRNPDISIGAKTTYSRSEERRVGKECRL